MKFYGNGNEIIWDKENNKALCKFFNGNLETDDENVINYLISKNFKHEEIKKVEEVKEEHATKSKKVTK